MLRAAQQAIAGGVRRRRVGALIDRENLGVEERVGEAQLQVGARQWQRRPHGAGDLEPARARVRDVVGAVAARRGERSASRR